MGTLVSSIHFGGCVQLLASLHSAATRKMLSVSLSLPGKWARLISMHTSSFFSGTEANVLNHHELVFFFFKLQSPCRPNLDFSSQISQTLNSSAGVRRSRRHRAEEELLCSTKADCQRSLASPSGRTLTLTLPLLRCRLFVIIRMAESMCFPLKFKNLFTIIRKACQSPASHLTAAVNFQQRNTATFWGVSYVLGPRSGAQSARWAYSK